MLLGDLNSLSPLDFPLGSPAAAADAGGGATAATAAVTDMAAAMLAPSSATSAAALAGLGASRKLRAKLALPSGETATWPPPNHRLTAA